MGDLAKLSERMRRNGDPGESGKRGAAGAKLSERMRMNADLVPDGSAAADIGCDHGYASIYLATEKHCRSVLATDVHAGPLAMAERNVRRAGLQERIRCRLGDGLEALRPGEADAVLIAGMGGQMICHILGQSPEVLAGVGTLILQPQSEAEKVREMLFALGFRIDREAFCEEGGKAYVAIRAVRCAGPVGEPPRAAGENPCDEPTQQRLSHIAELPYTAGELRYGRYLIERGDERYLRYLLSQKEKKERLLADLAMRQTPGAAGREWEIWQEIEELAELLRRMSQIPRADDRE